MTPSVRRSAISAQFSSYSYSWCLSAGCLSLKTVYQHVMGFEYFLLKVQYMQILEKTFRKGPITINRMFWSSGVMMSVYCVAVTCTKVGMLTSSPHPVLLRSSCASGVNSNTLISQPGPRPQEGHKALKPTFCGGQTLFFRRMTNWGPKRLMPNKLTLKTKITTRWLVSLS